MDASQIGKRAWSYAGVLQDAGLSCFEYVEQLTLLLFLKMADQLTEEPYNREADRAAGAWLEGAVAARRRALEEQYRDILEKLGLKPGMLGVIFKGARCEIHNPALLKQLIVNLIDKVDWLSLPVDVKGTIYEELLQRSARNPRAARGNTSRPRPVIQAMCEVMQPTPHGPHLRPCSRHRRLSLQRLSIRPRQVRKATSTATRSARCARTSSRAMELSPKVGRMCAMNLYLHGIGGDKVVIHSGPRQPGRAVEQGIHDGSDQSAVRQEAEPAVCQRGGRHGEGRPVVVREDFWTSTSNKQLNFVQHIYSLLKIDGRAAVVCPTTCCSRAAPARRCGATCCRNAASTRCCACRPASGIRRA